MTRENPIRRLLSIVAGVALASAMVGCTSSNTVSFTNMSDTWVNVSYYVKSLPAPVETTTSGDTSTTTSTPAEGPTRETATFFAKDMIQVKPGETAKYRLTGNQNYKAATYPLIHVEVEPVSPSWESSGEVYWIELLTDPPMTIVATGTAENLQFLSRDGALALIPDSTRAGRFDHKIATVETPETPSK